MCFFRNEPTEDFSEIPAFRIKSNWSSTKGHPALEMFLNQMEGEIFSLLPGNSASYNLTKVEWKAMRGLAEDRSIVITPADKGSCVVVWDTLTLSDYLAEGENHLKDNNTYQDVKFGDDDLVKFVEKSNQMFKQLLFKQNISSSEFNYFSYNYKKSTNLGKMYLLPKIYKRLESVPGRPVISNCGTPTEKVSEFLDYHLKPTMQSAKSYIKDSSDFLRKLNDLGKLTENAILVTTDVLGLYPSIPHADGLEALSAKLEEREDKIIATEDLLQMARFVLKNNFFEFDSKIKQQISGTAIGTKFAPPYVCIFMDKFETDFLTT